MVGCDWKRLSSAIVCIMLLALTAIICIPSRSSADVLRFGLDPQLVGFATTFGSSPGSNGNIIDFAVLRPNSAFDNILSSSYQPAAGSPAFDASKYTYLYQVANVSSSTPHTLQSFGFNPTQQSGVPNTATSVGTFTNTATNLNTAGNLRFDFTNQGAVVNAQGNNLQSVNAFGIQSSLVANSNRINVSSTSLPHGSTGLIWNFTTGNFAPGAQSLSNGIGSGATSPIFGYQSDQSPRTTVPGSNGREVAAGPVLNGVIQPTGQGLQTITPLSGAFGVPFAFSGFAAPEPGTVLLMGSGLVGLVGLRRKRQVQQTEAN